jgi:hypothetical protein
VSQDWKRRLLASKGQFPTTEHRLRVLPGQEGLAFPKVERVKVKGQAGPSEAHIQEAVNDKADGMDIGFVRIPDHVYQRAGCPEICGIPDNIFLFPLASTGGRYGIYFAQELKRKRGKPREGQKEWMARNGGVVADTAPQAFLNLEQAAAFADSVDKMLRNGVETEAAIRTFQAEGPEP